jgi:uncharacterized protein (TIGR03118 family)
MFGTEKVWSMRAWALRALALTVAVGFAGCGGGYSGSSMAPATVTISVAPTSITLGQSAVLTWSTNASGCTATGAWSGSQSASGTLTVTPTASGASVYTLVCTGGIYSPSTGVSATLTVNPQSGFTLTALVADAAGTAAVKTDANLVNAWGIAFGAGPAWVANNKTETSTLYDGNGVAQPNAAPLVVKLPDGAGPTSFDPTGIVFNGSTDFSVTKPGKTGVALFIYSGEGGMIAGWSPGVDLLNAVTMYTDAGGAVYKGLAIANNGTANFLYATDFHNGKVDVFDATFTKQTPTPTSFAFTDPALPAGYAPFGIQAIKNGAGGATQIYVTYAKPSPPDNHDEIDGAGLGLVDLFDANGVFVKRLIDVGGALNAPWGMALAPADFGTLSNTLLVGNFGDGAINAYDPASGTFVAALKDAGGTAIVVPGLWGIAFGNDAGNQPHNTLFVAGGPNAEANGSYGRIDLGGAPTLGAAPVVTVTPLSGAQKGTVTLTATVVDPLAVTKVEFFANTATSIGTKTTAPFTVQWDTTTIADGAVTITATATDADGNTGTSPAVTVTVQNTVAAATTLTELQTNFFGPICSGCHTGVGASLPGSMNLSSAAASFASLVGVASVENASFLRVKAGDAANSYIIHKLLGSADITGARMPFGGTPLTQAQIDTFSSWINAGAANN